ncbi:MAG TPA: response regulator [Flavitalea sp.]|nr:response regulator [Flavitalea sp.]
MGEPSHYNLLIAEDNPVVREVLRGVIRHDERLRIVGEAANGQAALELVDSLKPDLVCLDVLMPGLDGLSALKTIKEKYPDTRVSKSRPFTLQKYGYLAKRQ